MKNFDEVYEDDKLRFVLGGEEFSWRPLHYRKFGDGLDRELAEAREKEAKAKEAAKKAEEAGEDVQDVEVDDDKTVVEAAEDAIDTICEYLVGDSEERFRTLVKDPEKRISFLQLTELHNWLLETANNRPTDTPSPSDAGLGRSAPTLQAV